MNLSTPPRFQGHRLDTSAEALGRLPSSSDAVADARELRRRFQQDGHLFLPGLSHRRELLIARLEMRRKLDAAGRHSP